MFGGEERRAEEGELDSVEGGLIAIEENEGFGSQRGQLPAQFAADRTARTGDEDAPSGDRLRDLGEIGVDGTAADEVLDPEVADVGDLHPTVDEFGQRRDGAQPATGHLQAVAARVEEARIGIGDRDDDARDVEPVDHLGDVVARAPHPHPVDAQVPLARIVVDEADGQVRALRIREHLPDEGFRGVAGTDDEHPLPLPGPRRELVHPADDVAGARHEDEGGEDEEEDERRVTGGDDHEGARDREADEDEPAELGEAAVVVAAPVEAEAESDEQLQGQGHGEDHPDGRPADPLEAEDQPGQSSGEDPGGGVEDDLQPGLVLPDHHRQS